MGCCLAVLAVQPVAAESSPLTINAIVPGQPPAVAPVIETPQPGANLQQQQIDVTGTCQTGLVVKIFRNDIFAGSALCQADGTFSLQIDLLENKNDLVARQYDLLSQSSPSSDTVTIFRVVSSPGDEQTARFQLVIDYDYNFQGIFINEPFNLPIHFAGGTPPYAVSVDWGDDSTKVYSREDASEFHAEHTFAKAGPHTVKIHVSDKEGQEASLQFVLIVNGGTVAALPIKNSDKTVEPSKDVWNAILYSSLATGGASFTAGFLVASFWESMRLKITGKPKVTPTPGPEK